MQYKNPKTFIQYYFSKFFLSMSSICLIINKTFIIINNFYISFFAFINKIFLLIKKHLSNIISILMLVNKKVFIKLNISLFQIKNLIINIF